MYKKAKYIFEIIKLALENKKFHLYSALKDEVALNKGVSLLTTSIAPMLNPFIYTLRNKQVKRSFHDILERLIFYSKK